MRRVILTVLLAGAVWGASAEAHDGWKCRVQVQVNPKADLIAEFEELPQGLFVYTPPYSGPTYKYLLRDESGIIAYLPPTSNDNSVGVELIVIHKHSGEYLHTWTGISKQERRDELGKCRRMRIDF
jgi:hypothetical protein